MSIGEIAVEVAPELRVFVAGRNGNAGAARVDGVSTLGHVVESLGVPLTEVGELLVGDRPVSPSYQPVSGDVVTVRPVPRPQRLGRTPRFLLDIHLGTLARRLRLLGIDTAYENPDIGDAALAARSSAEQRVLLSRDRGLLRRREIFAGAYIYSHRTAEQLDDVLSRFAPPLAPWTRCTACNGLLAAADPEAVREFVPAATEPAHDNVTRCTDCGRTYWRGAHHANLDAIVSRALEKFGA
ncbi:Mut7-C RNAse domain-containing protein [Nocardia terpenica]|uniref:Twitching motility protein PilT n=1 Tax=Nocardia terpenica TaxID=455432 RepID=A0A6G9Z8T3_9NOCA|nr:Mut7-C RNAse domain-containing protein [Nocardia terpenica]QIS21938.1 hypothetical protein F6W96_29990 [Nocardia terpenica]